MSNSSRNKTYAVVGAGIAGLSAAVHLAVEGHKVIVLEKNERVGGKLNTWSSGGFAFDTGPHVVTMLFAFQELFKSAGKRLEDYVELIRLPTVCRYHFPDGRTLDCPANPKDAAQTLEREYPGSTDGFNRFLAHSSDVYNKTTDTFLKQDVADAMRAGGPGYAVRNMSNFLGLKPFESLNKCVTRYFADEELRQIFRLYALYSGSHPKRCSSIFSTVAHVQWQLGTYYIVGGVYQLANALKSLLDELGVTVKTRTEVTEIIIDGRTAKGIALQSDSGSVRLMVDGVICNQDVLTAHSLMPKTKPIPKIEPSTSAFLLLLGIKGEYDVLAHHNSFLTSDEWGEYASIFDNGLPPPDPTIGVSCQSVSDGSRAPTGMSNLFVMANVPALGPEFEWTEAYTKRYRQTIIEKLERTGLPGLVDRIIVEQLWTPKTLATTYNSARGAIYGLSSNGFRQAFLRPAQQAKGIRNLIYAGGSTHPGGGMPLCVLSGKIAAQKLIKVA